MQNFYACFVRSVERWPSAVAVEVQRPSGAAERLTYRELRNMAESVGGWLVQNHVPRGARCAVLANNGPRWVAAYLGALAAGCVAVPLDTAFKTEQIATLLKDSGAAILFVDARHLALVRPAAERNHVQLVLLDSELPAGSAEQRFQSLKHLPSPAELADVPRLDDILAGAQPFTPVEASVDDVAVILYTSGTTSDPKGVMLTHGNLLAEADAVFKIITIGPTDAILGILPLFHALAQMANLLLPFAAGARVVYLESLNTAELMRALRERDITVFACVPQFFYLIHERIMHQVEARGAFAKIIFNVMLEASRIARGLGWNLGKTIFRQVHVMLGSKMRFLVTGGSRFDPAVARDLHALGFDILQAYGLTETSGGATITPPQDNTLGSVGKALPGLEIKIVGPEPQPEGPAVGEIAMRAGVIMKGYYNRPEATAETLRDGWLYSGDLGYLDSRGNLFVTGRRKDIIVLSSGKNIYPEEIEAHYQKSPFIKEICVLGLESAPGQPFAERLHAVIVPNFDALRARKIVNAGEVIRFDVENLSSQVPSTKRILSYDIWQTDLPRTTTRKLKRFAIRKEVLEKHAHASGATPSGTAARELSEDDLNWLDQRDVGRALEVIKASSKLKRDQVHPDDSLELDLGLDSMERVELLVALEEALGAHVDDSVVSEVYTVRELVAAVQGGARQSRNEFVGWDSILASDPPLGDVAEFAKRRRIASVFWFMVGRLVQLIARDLFHLRASGVEKLPASGPFILCPNHQSYIDPAVVCSLLPWPVLRRSFSVGTSDIFGVGLFRRIASSFRLFPVDPDRNLVPAMRIGAYGLRRGMALLLYPEGERSMDGPPKRFKKGAAILAVHLRVPIYPVAIDGFWDAWPRGQSFQKFAPLRVMIGDPVYPPERFDDPEKAYAQMIGEVRARVVRMWEQIHGVSAPQQRSAAAD
jgi:long-chain acyl-CoA synthetase